MNQDQRRSADELLERANGCNQSAAMAPHALAHVINLLDMMVPALFPVADDLAEDPMHPTGRCTCGGGGTCEWCLDAELRAQNIPEGHPTTLGFYLVSHAGDHAPSNIYIAELSHCPSIGTLEWWHVATEHSETPAQFWPGKVLSLLHSREGGVCGDNLCRLCSTAEPETDDEPCNCPQALDAELRVARLYDALAIAMAHVERLKSAEDDRHQAEERADHLDRGHEVLAEELAAAHTLTAHLERRIKALADRLAEAEADGSAAVDKLTSETARADRADLRVTQLAERIAEDVADETSAAVRLANVCVHLGCCDLAFAETATQTMVERAAQVDAAEAALTTARAEWTSTRADLESANERLHERLRLLQRTCPGPSPAAQVMQPVTPFHRDEAVRLVVERLRRIPTGCANHYTDWANQIAFGSPDPGDQNYEPLIYLAQESVMAGRESMAGLKRGGKAKAPDERLAAVLADADEHGPTVAPVAVLDDPRMDGVYWNDAADVTAEMVRAWPFWEWWTADETAVLSAQYVAHGSMAVPTHKLRPLRLPGMVDSSGIVRLPSVASLDRVRVSDWQIRRCGKWMQLTNALRSYHAHETADVRPAIWATLDTTAADEPTG